MRGPIVGGVVMASLAALAFACGDDTSGSTSSGSDAGTSTNNNNNNNNNNNRPPSNSDASTTTYTTTYGGCNVFPRDNPWNMDISATAVDATLTAIINDAYSGHTLTANWGKLDDGAGYIVNKGTAATPYPIDINDSSDLPKIDKIACPSSNQADTCYPLPTTTKVSRGSNNRVLFLDTTGSPTGCTVYELDNSETKSRNDATIPSDRDSADFASIWHLNTNTLKTDQNRSADEAGLSIFAGLVKREDITKGTLTHAVRMTMGAVRGSFIHPATHSPTSSTSTSRFPMGTRFRVKSSVAETGFTGDALIILRGLKKYGAILADRGTDWQIDGEADDGWNVDDINSQFSNLHSTDFEVVNTGTAVTQTN